MQYMYRCACMYVGMYVRIYVRSYVYLPTYVSMYVCTCVCIYVYVCVYVCMYVCMTVCIYVYICTVAEIVGLALQFATQNCLGCYSVLNLGSTFTQKLLIISLI